MINTQYKYSTYLIVKAGIALPDFLSLGISSQMTKTLRDYGIVTPTPIQVLAIPFIMEGKDVIAQAQTGTGKTLAFVLPILQKAIPNGEKPFALIITPTRELALQITEEIEKLVKHLEGVRVLAVYGGQDVNKQLHQLQHQLQIVVGTPGRLLDHIRRGTLQLSELNCLILDEADQMLHIGFLNEVEKIIEETPQCRQTLMFSATIPVEIRKLAAKYMQKPEFISIEKKQIPAQNVKQIAIYTIDRAKQASLISLIETHRPYLAVIFCRTKRRVGRLYESLQANGVRCDQLHGDLSQAKREEVMKRFRQRDFQCLIATDVAARGLDIDGITHVFNYDIPQDAESYIHRIGRTGRAGTRGIAITLYSSKDRPILDIIEKELNMTIPKQNPLKTTQIQKKKAEPEKESISKKRTIAKQKATRSQGTMLSKSGRKTSKTAPRKNASKRSKSR
jgi:ATP-dependent RNA helicase DeaD